MVLRKFLGVVASFLIVFSAPFAMAGIPDVNQCDSYFTEPLDDKVIVFVVPGSEPDAPLNEAVEVGHPYPAPQVIVNATIEVIVQDAAGVPIPNFPNEDIWLECPPGVDIPEGDTDVYVGLVPCFGGASADMNTDPDGWTYFQDPFYAGGQSFGPSRIVINGNGLPNTVNMGFNSSDINGDGVVNLIDLQTFTADFFDAPAYHFRSDFYYDEIVNLIDLPWMARTYGSNCP